MMRKISNNELYGYCSATPHYRKHETPNADRKQTPNNKQQHPNHPVKLW
ncbi:hypothetical protein [Bartonella sp. MM73XJBT]|nr:hypothetical protein [Bartonella sp. MM73XJBT]